MKNDIGFIFDMDGTLVDSMPYHIRSWQQLLAERGIQMSAQEIERRNHGILPEVISKMLGEQLPAAEVVAIGERKEELYRDLYRPHLEPLAGCRAFLQAANQLGVPMAVATMANRVNVSFILDGMEIRDYFKIVVGEEDVQHGKPSPEVFQFAAQGLRLLPENCIVFEDSLSGVQAAQRAGMRVVFINTSLKALPTNTRAPVLICTDNYINLKPEELIESESI
jgi:beta-phosphoglucomutase family hydrolase